MLNTLPHTSNQKMTTWHKTGSCTLAVVYQALCHWATVMSMEIQFSMNTRTLQYLDTVLAIRWTRVVKNPQCREGYGLLLESSVTFLMLCCTQTLCWSSSCSLSARSSNSAFRLISLSAISRVLQPGPTPLKKRRYTQWCTDGSPRQLHDAEHMCCFKLTSCFIIYKMDFSSLSLEYWKLHFVFFWQIWHQRPHILHIFFSHIIVLIKSTSSTWVFLYCSDHFDIMLLWHDHMVITTCWLSDMSIGVSTTTNTVCDQTPTVSYRSTDKQATAWHQQ